MVSEKMHHTSIWLLTIPTWRMDRILLNAVWRISMSTLSIVLATLPEAYLPYVLSFLMPLPQWGSQTRPLDTLSIPTGCRCHALWTSAACHIGQQKAPFTWWCLRVCPFCAGNPSSNDFSTLIWAHFPPRLPFLFFPAANTASSPR